MLFGIGTITTYIVFMSKFDSLTIKEAKNFIIFLPIIFILALIELFCEIKYGIKKSLQLTGKVTKSTFKLAIFSYKEIKFRRLKKKLEQNKKLTDRQIKWMKKYVKEKKKDAD